MRTLREAGQQPLTLQGKVLILPFGGRVLAVYPTERVNAFWINPALGSVQSAKALFQDRGWINLGGGRTWIVPEVDTHMTDPKRMAETYFVPRSVDPADYHVVTATEREATLESEMDVTFQRSGNVAKLKVTRTVSLMDAPPIPIPTTVAFAGYSEQSKLAAIAPLAERVQPGLWLIIQVPRGGQIVLPLRGNGRPRAFIGTPEFVQTDDLIRCEVDTSASFKFSIRADDCLGIMIYLNTRAEQPFMVAREFAVQKKALYADVPYDDLSETGHMQQVYVDDGGLGGFGELEYHTPAIGRVEGTEVGDKSSVWTFAGPAEVLREISQQLIRRAGASRFPRG